MGFVTKVRRVEWAELSEKIIALEDGELNQAETIALFQDLVDTGHALTLPGSYGRYAMDLIEGGFIRRGGCDA